ncbi:uncharacterized protein LOC134680593 [Mytilus trossulus]|uniref:uncharacterized protein LOC134680593 n=1 Tax=Mytilus trossulus TaxID=6551 RepID=UPI003006195E
MGIRHKTDMRDLREAMHDMETAHTKQINSVKDEIEKTFITNINAVRSEISEIESRFFKDVKNVETNILELVKDLKVEMNERESRFNREVNTLNGRIQVFSTEKDNKIIKIKNEIENVINEKDNDIKEEMTEVKEKMLISLTKINTTLLTMRTDYKLSIRKTNNRCMNSIYRMKTEIRPAFSATFTNERAIPLTHGEILKFDNVHLNIGEGYDPATGYFFVPKAGIYFVSCTIRSIENKHIHAYLWKNTDRLLLAYGRNWNTGSFGFPIDLQKGDLLFVRHDDGPYIINEEVHGGSTSVFAATFISNIYSEDIKFNFILSKNTLMVI